VAKINIEIDTDKKTFFLMKDGSSIPYDSVSVGCYHSSDDFKYYYVSIGNIENGVDHNENYGFKSSGEMIESQLVNSISRAIKESVSSANSAYKISKMFLKI